MSQNPSIGIRSRIRADPQPVAAPHRKPPLRARKSGHRLEHIIDTIPALAWTARPDGHADFFNRRWLDYTGLAPREARGWAWIAAIHPEERDAVIRRWRSAVESGGLLEAEARVRRFDGEHQWFLIRANALCDPTGRILKWYGTNTDIDGLKRAHGASKENEERIHLIVDSMPGFIFTTTPDGEVEFVNNQVLQYFGRTREELRGWRVSDTVHPDDLLRTCREVGRGIESKQAYEFEQRLRRHDGTYRWFRFRAQPLLDDHGRVIRWYGLLADIDDLKRAEDALRTTEARLSRATQLAAMTEIAASIAHEINQPLAAVVANGHACCRWLSTKPPNVKRALRTASRVVRDGNEAAEVVKRIRSLFRTAPVRTALLSMNDVIAEVLTLFADECRARSVKVETELQSDLPRVVADRVQMQQLMANLVRNGIEAMETTVEPSRVLRISTCRDDANVVVLVRDEGTGIDDTDIVFQSFYTTKENGMGMGLAICRSIVEAHDGRLWAAQNAVRGATMGIALPVAEPNS